MSKGHFDILGRSPAEVAEWLRTAHGRRQVPFVDYPWWRAGHGDIDVFAEYSRHAGRSAEVSTCLVALPGGPKPLAFYLVPEENAAPLLRFLGGVMFAVRRTGGVVMPYVVGPRHEKYAEVARAPDNPYAAFPEVAGDVHYLFPAELPATHPKVVALKAGRAGAANSN